MCIIYAIGIADRLMRPFIKENIRRLCLHSWVRHDLACDRNTYYYAIWISASDPAIVAIFPASGAGYKGSICEVSKEALFVYKQLTVPVAQSTKMISNTKQVIFIRGDLATRIGRR